MRANKLIQFYLTNVCNSRCKTCDIWQECLGGAQPQHIPVENVIRVIETFPRADFVFGGGEFTLYKHREELLDYCSKRHISYTVLSNCIKPDTLSDLVDRYNVKNVTISCDGVRHDTIRGVEGNLEKIKAFVLKYKDIIPNLKISYTYSRFNQEYIDKDMEMFKSWGIEKVYLCIAVDMDLLNNRSHCDYLLTSIDGLRNHMKMFYDKDREYLDRIFNKWKKKKCDSTTSVFTIYSDGNIVRCQSHMSSEILGNIYRDNFFEVIRTVEKYRYAFSCPYDKQCGLLCQRRYD